MPRNNLMGFALNMIQHNPALQNNPWAGQPYGSCAGYGCGCGCN